MLKVLENNLKEIQDKVIEAGKEIHEISLELGDRLLELLELSDRAKLSVYPSSTLRSIRIIYSMYDEEGESMRETGASLYASYNEGTMYGVEMDYGTSGIFSKVSDHRIEDLGNLFKIASNFELIEEELNKAFPLEMQSSVLELLLEEGRQERALREFKLKKRYEALDNIINVEGGFAIDPKTVRVGKRVFFETTYVEFVNWTKSGRARIILHHDIDERREVLVDKDYLLRLLETKDSDYIGRG